jgi:restriction system protein
MKLKMSPNSLFAVLLRSPWWISFALAAAVALGVRLALPAQLQIYAVFSAIPFFVIGVTAAWKQLRAPSAARVAHTLAALSAMSWPQFADTMETAFRQDGHEVKRLPGPAADFELAKSGRTTLVGCRRWKAARPGVEPLRELHAQMRRRDASGGICVVLGEPSEQASRFAAEHQIELLRGDRLAAMLSGIALKAAL